MNEILNSVLDYLFANYPVASTVFMVIGILRAINKPLFSLLRTFVLSTPSQSDDAILDEVEHSKVYTTITYILDWFGSVKIPVKVVAVPEKQPETPPAA